MFELLRTSFHRGVFELELTKKVPVFLKPFLVLGPLNSRIVGLIGILLVFLLAWSPAPTRFIVENGFASSFEEAAVVQRQLSQSILGFVVVFYAFVFMFRKPQMRLWIDRNAEKVGYFYLPLFRFAPKKESHINFQDVDNIEVFSKDKDPKTPAGFMKISFSSKARAELKEVSFKFMTLEQFEFFPQNFYRMTDVKPKGDWTDLDA